MKDLGGLMKKAQEMQAKMAEAQQRLESLEVTGEAGAGLVKLTLTAKGEMRGLQIDKSVMDPEDPSMLEDLIKAAHNDAKRKADAAQVEAMSDATKGMGLPPGIDLPFGTKPGPF